MFKKLSIVLFSVFLLAFNASAGTDGNLELEKDQKSHNMLTFIYKEDYTKPKKTGIYRCIKTH